MKDFQSESYEEKLKISMNIITNLKDRWNAQAQQIYDKISKMDKVPEPVVDAIYKDFCTSVERINQDKVNEGARKFDEMKQYMQNLRQQEERDRARENTEAILEQIEEDDCDAILDRLNDL